MIEDFTPPMELPYFDKNGDLWIPVQAIISIPSKVETLSFTVSWAPVENYGFTATKMNLTKYIKHLVRESYVTGEWNPEEWKLIP